MQQLPADRDPFMIMAAAAEHVLNGVPEVELEWWADPEELDGTPERRLTITMRNADRWTAIGRSANAVAEADHPAGTGIEVPDTPEGL